MFWISWTLSVWPKSRSCRYSERAGERQGPGGGAEGDKTLVSALGHIGGSGQVAKPGGRQGPVIRPFLFVPQV